MHPRRVAQPRHTEYVAPLHIADVYAGLDDHDRALDWLEASFEDRNSYLPSIALEPFYDPLRDEPRFKALVARMRLNNSV